MLVSYEMCIRDSGNSVPATVDTISPSIVPQPGIDATYPVSVEIENKENDDVVQNEQTEDTGSYPPCVMVDGVIYKDTGYVASMPCLLYTSRCV